MPLMNRMTGKTLKRLQYSLRDYGVRHINFYDDLFTFHTLQRHPLAKIFYYSRTTYRSYPKCSK